MDLGLKGRVALVTGASAGIGHAVARELAREGARVVVVSRDASRIEAAAARLAQETKAEVTGLVGDVSVAEDPERLVNETAKRLGRLDIVVSNAGGPRSGNFDDVGADDFGRAVELTLRSVERLMRASVPHLKKNGWGRIVNLTSITAKEPHDGLVISNTLRPAVHGLSKSVSRDVARHGITVNCVCPGFTDTERLEDLAKAAAGRRSTSPEQIRDGWKARIPRGELGRPEEIAAAVAFLCSERASFLNGVSLQVDGGESRALL